MLLINNTLRNHMLNTRFPIEPIGFSICSKPMPAADPGGFVGFGRTPPPAGCGGWKR